MTVVKLLGESLLMSLAMFWKTGWSLVLGFALSGALQALVSKDRMREQLGRSGLREIALAMFYGAASSSCSYASAAVSKTLFKKGAGLIPSLAFLFSSTNLVIELGVIIYLLMGWQFTLAEWAGGIVLIAIMSILVKLTYPAKLVAEARAHVESSSGGHEHGDVSAEGASLADKLRNPQTRIAIAQNFTMDLSMLWLDLATGFVVAGAMATLVPASAWKILFAANAPDALRIPLDALAGPLVAIFTFVCSIGNVPMAAVLWASGISFGGVLAFLYSDLIIIPLLDIYRKFYGWKAAAYIGAIFFATIALSGIVMELLFRALHLIPAAPVNMRASIESFSFDYTFWLNLIAAAAAIYLVTLNARNPSGHCCGHSPESGSAPGEEAGTPA